MSRIYVRLKKTSKASPTLESTTLLPHPFAPSIQAKLTVGKPNDQYEQEADQVADSVVDKIQRMETSQEAEDELQMKPLSGSLLQKQETGEQEDEEIMMKPDLQKTLSSEEEDELNLKPDLQREAIPEEEEEVMMKSEHGEKRTLNKDVESTINQKKGSGAALPDIFRAKVEQALGADFGGVRVHTDQEADTLSRSLSARAFTTGNDIFFKQGEYNPDSTAGQKLITHELAHTIQQGASSSFGQMKPLSDNLETQKQFSTGILQRDGEDTLDTQDPLPSTKEDLQDDVGLYYGLERGYRGVTTGRLKKRREAAGVDMDNTPLPTIDQYNKAVGINEVMGSPTKPAKGIFKVREALNDPDNWDSIMNPPADAQFQTPRNKTLIAKWKDMLVAQKEQIGLYDYGDPRGGGIKKLLKGLGTKIKLGTGNSFSKNKYDAKDTELTPSHISSFLSTDSYENGKEALKNVPKKDREVFALSKIGGWIYLAFFRRTSKLGLEFATSAQGLNAKVRFNTAGQKSYGDRDTYSPTALKDIAEKSPGSTKRQITVSEYRHLKRLMKAGKIKPEQIIEYAEAGTAEKPEKKK